MLEAVLCVALLICFVRLQGLGMPYSADAYSTTSRQTLTHPSAAYPSLRRFSSDSYPSLVLTHWRRELQTDFA